jgi:hypothetical protein
MQLRAPVHFLLQDPLLPMFADQPRVYMDTALLCQAADRKIAPGVVEKWFSAIRAAGAVLVLGPGHMADLHRRTDADTRNRLFELLARFPRVAAIDSSPALTGVEWERMEAQLTRQPSDPARDLPPGDLVLSYCTGDVETKFREQGYTAREWMDVALELETLSSEASGFGLGADPDRRSSRHRQLVERAFGMTARGEDGIGYLLQNVVPKEKREDPAWPQCEAAIRAEAQSFAEPMQLLGLLTGRYGGTAERLARSMKPEWHGIPPAWRALPNGRERWLELARRLAPGQYLKAMLLHDKNRDPARRPKPSDAADELHVAMLPYVDVMTVDRENLSIMERHTGAISRIRRALVLANADLDGLQRALDELPQP